MNLDDVLFISFLFCCRCIVQTQHCLKKKKHLLVKSDTYYLIEYEVFFDLFLTRTCTFIEIHVLSNILRVHLYDELVEGGYFFQNIIAYTPLYGVKDSITLKCSTQLT